MRSRRILAVGAAASLLAVPAGKRKMW